MLLLSLKPLLGQIFLSFPHTAFKSSASPPYGTVPVLSFNRGSGKPYQELSSSPPKVFRLTLPKLQYDIIPEDRGARFVNKGKLATSKNSTSNDNRLHLVFRAFY